jgi:hypothetical protein
MNTIEQILKKKNINIFEIYTKAICIDCDNKNNDRDLCKITRKIDNTVKCENYARCMQNKCKTCKVNCWAGITAKRHKPIMKNILK